jgi:ubiquinol-cytochrome c reductase cytochrome b subunit
VFVISFIALGWLGTQPATTLYTNFARFFSLLYFGFFASLLIIPRFEKTKPVPDRVTS